MDQFEITKNIKVKPKNFSEAVQVCNYLVLIPSSNPKISVKIMQIGIDTNLQIKNFSEKKGHHHPAMGPVSNSVPPPGLKSSVLSWLLVPFF